MQLPVVSQSALDIRPVDWLGLPKKFFNPGELEVLVALVKSIAEPPARCMIEIGVHEGRNARAILREVKTIELYIGIDVPKTYVPSKRVQHNEVPDIPGKLVRGDPLFHLVIKPRGSLDLTPADLPACDVVFIDGDHGAEAVWHDTELARNLVRPGGLIIWHDYHDIGTVDVRDVLDQMYKNGAPIVHVEKTWLAYMKVGSESGW